MSPSEPLQSILLVWLAFLGGSIGSFLNVVVYRLPRGMNLSVPGSHCPRCKHPIRWYDNLPVIGWVALGGRCRDCRLPIAVRYPLVEAWVAALFAGLALVEVWSRGANLPLPLRFLDDYGRAALDWPQALGIYGFHLWLLCTLLAAWLIEFDGQSVPYSLGLPGALLALLAPCAWPYLHPVPVFRGLDDGWWGLMTSLAGGLAGLAIGAALSGRVEPARRSARVVPPLLVGLFLGWQTVLVLGFAVGAACGVEAILRWVWPRLRRWHATAWWFVFACGWLVCWNALTLRLPWLR